MRRAIGVANLYRRVSTSSTAGAHLWLLPAERLAATGFCCAACGLQRGLHSTSVLRAVGDRIPLQTGRDRVVVLGTGWAAGRLARDLDTKLYDLTVISPRNHVVFTPLLASACVGTLEPRSVAVPILKIKPAIKLPQNHLYAAWAKHIDPKAKLVECVSDDGVTFSVGFDKLAICTGSQGSTFGTPGVEEHAHFLREVGHAEQIRNHLLTNWGLAGVPGRDAAEQVRMLHVVVVGGGPTGVEFAGELMDFVNVDLRRIDPDRARDIRVTLIEASELLGAFDVRLREYAAGRLMAEGVHLQRGIVAKVNEKDPELQDGQRLPYGICVWSTGVGPTDFTTSLPFAKTAKGRVAVDEYLRVLVHPEADPAGATNHPAHGPTSPDQVAIDTQETEDADGKPALEPVDGIYALGDCCANPETPLPALAQVAEQQGKYLAHTLNSMAKGASQAAEKPFVYHHLGSMASVGGKSAILELGEPRKEWFSMSGFSSWVAWRSAYLTRLGTVSNRLYVMVDWTTSFIFGRDVSRW